MKSRFVYHLRSRLVFARWHMTLICLLTLGGGVLVSKGLLWLELSHPALRYGIAACAGYALFFLGVAVWVRLTFGRATRDERGTSSFDGVDLIDLPVSFPRGGSSPSWSGAGGRFSGGGASESWGNGIAASAASSTSSSSSVSSGGSSGGSSFDIGDSEELAVVLIAVAALAAILGGAFYVVYIGPEILLEAAFETLLVAGVFQRARTVPAEGWAWVVLKKTWWAFGIILVLLLLLGQVIKVNCPEAKSFADYRALCMGKR